jgi:saccharopine dehydrogenase (NADP+, L-glutamate forming)
MTIHWCGTGLSSIPGLRKLVEEFPQTQVWNRSTDKAKAAVGDLTDHVNEFSLDALGDALQPGDVAVSMLPGDWHVLIAKLCIEKGAHFVSSSYISPEMRDLDTAASEAGVSLINEVGLDPGIDHLMAHWLVADYRASDAFAATNALSFTSYCGGVPKIPNAFRYKFSWAPAGVLKALKSPSRSIRAYSELKVAKPWDAITSYIAPLPTPESFEVYPNRDSLPFLAEYGFDKAWPIKEFVRGTLRLNGWAEAWASIFEKLETLSGAEADEWITQKAAQLVSENAYEENEPDRVVLCVSLLAENEGVPVYHKTYTMDAWGDLRGSAMARLVSGPVVLAVKAVQDRAIAAGVHAAPSDPRLVQRWMEFVDTQAQYLHVANHINT